MQQNRCKNCLQHAVVHLHAALSVTALIANTNVEYSSKIKTEDFQVVDLACRLGRLACLICSKR